jgi:GDP-D-mannose dehydratase
VAREVVAAAAPEVVYHLAARAHVGASWEDPQGTIAANLGMTVALLEAVRACAPEAVVVVVGSGEQYGPPDRLPTTEDAPLRPQNPYAVSKAAGDLAAALAVSKAARELVAALGEVAGVAVDHVVDPARVRAHEVPEIRGSAERLHAATGWAPEIPLARTLADAVAGFRR